MVDGWKVVEDNSKYDLLQNLTTACQMFFILRENQMKTTKFEIADYLDSKEMIAEYLNTVLEEGNSPDLLAAIGHIAKAIGMNKIAESTGISRSSLSKSLSDGAKPNFETIIKVLRAIGGQINIRPLSA